MPNKSNNTFEVHNDEIWIMREGWKQAALATYREDYYNEITTHSWSLNAGGYPCNTALGGTLHRYIISKWYGEEVLKEMTQKGYIVEHMNNNHMDCRISNLEFMKSNRNRAKGQYFDKESKELRNQIAVNIFKDFSTNNYQITIGCNANIKHLNEAGEEKNVNVIKLLYNCAYSIVVLDAEQILTQYDEQGQFDLRNMNCIDYKIIEAPDIILSEEEKDKVMIERDGHQYLVIGNGKNYLYSINFDKGWDVSDNNIE